VEAPEGPPSGTHHISFYCDDIEKTIAELQARGVEFTEGITDAGFGLVTHFRMPGDFAVMLYQPRYAKRSAAERTTRVKRPSAKRVSRRSKKSKTVGKRKRKRA